MDVEWCGLDMTCVRVVRVEVRKVAAWVRVEELSLLKSRELRLLKKVPESGLKCTDFHI